MTDLPAGNIRRFALWRIEDLSGISGTGQVAEGVVFPAGTAVLHWTTPHAPSSIAIYATMTDLVTIHGHKGRTQVVWIDHDTASPAG